MNTPVLAEPLAPFTDAYVLKPHRFHDDRGWFEETWSARRFREQTGVETTFVQDNASLSLVRGVVRGLHYQRPPAAQAKLVRCSAGSLFDAIVDIRRGSPTYGKSASIVLSVENGLQLFVPRGFAHGFCALEPGTQIAYKVDGPYSPECDAGIKWNDPALGIDWPVTESEALLAGKDLKHPALADAPADFEWGGA